jgi:hypothetical protein
MKNPYRARVNEREFLNLPGIHDGAYVVAYVEDTSERELEENEYREGEHYNPSPRFILEIADCSTSINLEFEIENSLRRMNSFHKIDTLIAALQRFREGMAEECTQFKRRQRQLEELEAAAEAEKAAKSNGRPASARRRLTEVLGD